MYSRRPCRRSVNRSPSRLLRPNARWFSGWRRCSAPTIFAARRAQLKRDLKAGRQPIHELLLQPPDYLQTAKVFDLLLAVPKYGRVKVNKILSQCRISPSKTLGGLSERQRGELVALLRRR